MIFGFWRKTVANVAGWRDPETSSWFEIRSWAFCCSVAFGSQMLRSTLGIGASPAFAAHHSSRRSITFCCGDEKATCHGPVVIGKPLATSKCLNVVQSCPWKTCFGTM